MFFHLFTSFFINAGKPPPCFDNAQHRSRGGKKTNVGITAEQAQQSYAARILFQNVYMRGGVNAFSPSMEGLGQAQQNPCKLSYCAFNTIEYMLFKRLKPPRNYSNLEQMPNLQIKPKSNIALDAGEVRIVHPHGATGTHAVNQHILVLDDILPALQRMLVAHTH